MTPRLPPRVSISKLTLDRARQAKPETHPGEGGGSHTRASLEHGATRKSHAHTEPPVVRARQPETPPAPPPKTKGWHTDAQFQHSRRYPSSLHLAQPLTSPPSRNCLGLATQGNFYGTQTRPRRDLSAPPPTPDPHPKTWSSPQLHTQFLQLHFPWLCRSSIPTDPQNQNPPLSPQLLRSRALRSRVAPLAWLPYPLCPYPPGPRGSPRPTWPPPPKGGGISGVARDVATCAAEAACVRVGGGGPSGGRRAGPARR